MPSVTSCAITTIAKNSACPDGVATHKREVRRQYEGWSECEWRPAQAVYTSKSILKTLAK